MKAFVILLLFALQITYSQERNYTISGFVQDSLSGEKLIGANVYDSYIQKGTSTNTYGFFSLTIPQGKVNLTISFIGYQLKQIPIHLKNDTSLIVYLKPVSFELETIQVTGDRSGKIEERTQMSAITIPVANIQTLPAILGEVDVLKIVQLLPGVKSGNEGTSGMYVRGGGADQNLILLDDAPVYNVSHLFGFFSVFNSDAIKNVSLIKGGFPARYGSRLSSVLDINLKDGNMKEFQGVGTIGLISSKLTLEGPITTDKTSFIFSGRRTYFDLLARPFMEKDEYGGYYFYDINAKVNHIFSQDDRIFLSAYFGKDLLYAVDKNYDNSEYNFGWGNLTSTLRWNHIFTNKLFSNVTLIFSKYKFQTDTKTENQSGEMFSSKYYSGIDDWGFKMDLDYIPLPNHSIKFGGSGTFHSFTPEVFQVKNTSNSESIDTTLTSNPKLHSFELSLYAEDDYEITPLLKVNAGVHFSANKVPGKFYYSLQPRLGIRYFLAQDWALKGSFVTMEQYIHLLSSSSIGFPNDLWVPSTNKVPAQNSYQTAIGAAHSFDEYELSIEGYYKKMNNLIEYKEGASFFFGSKNWEDKVEMGKGYSYGIELFFQRKAGNLTGWIGYTFSRTMRQFDNINFGKEFPAKFDRRHDIAIVLVQKLYENLDFSCNWVYGTGNASTLPTGYFSMNPDILSNKSYNPWVWDQGQDHYFRIYTDKNGYRMPAYHRLDVSLKYQAGNNIWTLSVYNAYNRKNPFYIFFDDYNEKTVAKQVTIFPIIPSISYSYRF